VLFSIGAVVTTSSEIEERVRELLVRGEGPTIEYKSSLRWDYNEARVNKDLPKVIAKTLAAFLNSQGGTLLIGVNDGGELLGLEADISTLGKKSLDGFELAFRSVLASYLGEEVDSYVRLIFLLMDGNHVAVAECDAHPSPVYLRDGNRRELCIRSGNLTRSLDVAAAIAYVENHWRSPTGITEEQLRAVIADALAERSPIASLQPTERKEQIPIWLNLATRRVLDLFLTNLSRSHGWKRLNIVSPWIDEVGGPLATLNFDQMLRRLGDDRATVYVVTRPPQEDWHRRAIQRLADSGRANIALLPDLHVKLFTAQTLQSSFAMFGSANFTTRSLINREIGVLISSFGDGRALVRDLDYQAAEIYRHPARQLISKAKLSYKPT
jgi:Putative DNA-binding domain